MKKLFLIFPIALSFILITTITSCSKIQGCTDANAKNYDAAAEEDDGSCTFEGRIVFWLDEESSGYLQLDGITSLNYYLDNTFIGSSGISYWSAAPNCGQESSITTTKQLGISKSKSYPFEVKDGVTSETIWQSTVNITANECFKQQLSYD